MAARLKGEAPFGEERGKKTGPEPLASSRDSGFGR